MNNFNYLLIIRLKTMVIFLEQKRQQDTQHTLMLNNLKNKLHISINTKNQLNKATESFVSYLFLLFLSFLMAAYKLPNIT